MRAGLLTAICLFVGIIVVNGGYWSEWYDLTVCSGKPCGCKGYPEKCTQGKKVMIRSCIYDENDTSICQYDKGGIGAIKVVDPCYNEDVCPGWSNEWVSSGKCQCESKTRLEKRLCNNPRPIYPDDVKCWDDSTEEGAMVLVREANCTCTEEELKAMQTTTIKTTSTTTTASTTSLPCCKVEEYVYNVDDIDDIMDKIDEIEPTTTTMQNPAKDSELDLAYDDYYRDLVGELPPDCVPCDPENGDSGILEL